MNSKDDIAKKQREVLEATRSAMQAAAKEVDALKAQNGETARKSSLELSERLMRLLLRLDGLTGGPEWVAVQRKDLVTKVQSLINKVDAMGYTSVQEATTSGKEQNGTRTGTTTVGAAAPVKSNAPLDKKSQTSAAPQHWETNPAIEEARRAAARRKAAAAEEEKRKVREYQEAQEKLESQWDTMSTFPVGAVRHYLAAREPEKEEMPRKPLAAGAKLPVASPELSTFHPTQVSRPPSKYGRSAS